MEILTNRTHFTPLTTVRADSYSSEYFFVEKDLVYFDRTHNWGKPAAEIDAFGRYWGIVFGAMNEGQLSIGRLGGRIPLAGEWCIYIPPNSLVEWLTSPGIMEWHAFMGQSAVPADLP